MSDLPAAVPEDQSFQKHVSDAIRSAVTEEIKKATETDAQQADPSSPASQATEPTDFVEEKEAKEDSKSNKEKTQGAKKNKENKKSTRTRFPVVAKRHGHLRRPLKNIRLCSNGVAMYLINRVGMRRAKKEAKEIINLAGIALVAEVIRRGAIVAEHSKRSTIYPRDVAFAAGNRIYY